MPGIQTLLPIMQTQWYRHEVLANNLANSSTPGFKQDDVVLVPAPALADAAGAPETYGMVPWTDFSQGSTNATGRPLDLALNGPGFLVVQTPAGLRYTRGGALTVSQEGYLATATGAPILGEAGPITVPGGRMTVSARGDVQADGRTDRLRLVEFPRGVRLLKEGNGLFVPTEPGTEPIPARSVEVVGGALESSNVNPVLTMVGMMDSLRRYEAAQKAIQAIEDANHQASTEIGKV